MAADSNGHRRHKHDIAEAQQQRGKELKAIGESLSVVRAAPAVPACDQGELLSPLQHSQGLGGWIREPPFQHPAETWHEWTLGYKICKENGRTLRVCVCMAQLSPALHSQAAYR